ncbi:glycosyltransferase [Pseudoalteromonas sp. ACER1]|uniref:glycosyltransferase n=1 Tax=unclassified Pseudoalteromonas TaxID=194690 RepID=UPI001F15A7EB|nr:glycosyltransferase [Pseudoalteromonas sp. PAST1]MCF2848680.1 glycosyltransferase [Pseudoalteromonas sp. PAST1]MCO7209689.1 glycosyltransferase [Pseudoalteromonas sp. ACER1]
MSKKIMLINSLGVGGAERVFSNLANYLTDNSVDFKVVSLINKIDYEISSKVDVKFLSNRDTIGYLKLPIYFLKFFFLCWKTKPKVVQSHLFWANYINVLCSILFKYESQLVHCVSFNSKFKKGKVRTFHYFFCSLLLKKGTVNIFKSHEMRDEYINLFNISAKNSEVIYNPISVEIVDKKKPRKSTDEVLNICLVGRFHKSKRYFDLLEVAECLKDKVVFHCVGEGELLEDFKLRVKQKKLSSQFVFHGWLNKPSDILDASDVYLSCSESEGFPNALIEAMGRGLPVVHSDCKTGPKEILGEVIYSEQCYDIRQFGVTFPVGSIPSIIGILVALESNILSKDKLSALALSRVKELAQDDSFSKYMSLILKGGV